MLWPPSQKEGGATVMVRWAKRILYVRFGCLVMARIVTGFCHSTVVLKVFCCMRACMGGDLINVTPPVTAVMAMAA